MTTNRARAYGRVLTLISDLGPAKLHAPEQQAIRNAADALLFSNDAATDEEARRAVTALKDLLDRMVATDRLLRETADTVLDAVEGCGPQTDQLLLPVAA